MKSPLNAAARRKTNGVPITVGFQPAGPSTYPGRRTSAKVRRSEQRFKQTIYMSLSKRIEGVLANSRGSRLL